MTLMSTGITQKHILGIVHLDRDMVLGDKILNFQNIY